MSSSQPEARDSTPDETPGDGGDLRESVIRYTAGFGLSILLTLASFWVSGTQSVWHESVPVLLAALAIGQMGVHLAFFLHITSGPEGTNNIMALAFGVFVVALLVFGSIIIMNNLDDAMEPMAGMNHAGH